MTNNLGFFEYREGNLFCEDVNVSDIAMDVGSPVYIYSKATLLNRFNGIHEAFSEVDTTICFSVKSCGSLGILKIMAEAGSSFDVVSGGEIFRVKSAGGDTSRIVYAGVGKTDKEISFALENGIMMFNVESEAELANINRIAAEMNKTAPVALRINPDIDAGTHAKTTTGKKENKFGIAPETAEKIITELNKYPNVKVMGIDAHIGSPVNSIEPYAASADRLVAFIEKNRTEQAPFEYMNTGGGFGLLYNNESVPDFKDYASAIIPRVKKAGCKLVLEPGRSIAGNSAIVVAEAQYRKTTDIKNFVILNAGMQTLMRPALYDSYHFIWPVKSELPVQHTAFDGTNLVDKKSDKLVATDVVGPICESSDVFCKERLLPEINRGDLVAIFSTGAYGFTMSNDYNAHPRPAEVMVDGSSWKIIRKRQNWNDLISGETC